MRVLWPLGLENLRDDLAGREVAFPPFQTAGAKFAAVGAADLGGEAEGEAVGAFAEEIDRSRDKDALDVIARAKFPEEFSGCVGGALELRQLERGEVVAGFQVLAKCSGKIGHLGDRGGALLEKPFRNLLPAECGTIAEIPSVRFLVEEKRAKSFHRRDLVRIAL